MMNIASTGQQAVRVGRSGAGRLTGNLRKFGRERVGAFRLLFLIRLLQWPVRAVSRPVLMRIKRDPNLIAFGSSSDRFADNPAYLFLHMSTASTLRCVWVSGSQDTVDRIRAAGHEAVRRWSVEGIRVAVRASWYVFGWYRSDVNVWLSDGAIALNLWHGVGVKPIQRDRIEGAGSSVYTAPEGSVTARVFADERLPPDWLLTTSSMTTQALGHAFGVPAQRCLEFGYPRTDHLAVAGDPPALLVDDSVYATVQRNRPVVGYFPTFRDWSATLPGGVPMINEMSKIVTDQGGTFVFKAHHLVLELSSGDPAQPDGAQPTSDQPDPGVVMLDKDADLNAYLGQCDVLVTDYSSVSSDFLFLQRPVILFVPDLQMYEDTRGFHFDPLQMMPGIVTRTRDELYAALGDIGKLSVTDNTPQLFDTFWSPDAREGASARITRFIEGHLTSVDVDVHAAPDRA